MFCETILVAEFQVGVHFVRERSEIEKSLSQYKNLDISILYHAFFIRFTITRLVKLL